MTLRCKQTITPT